MEYLSYALIPFGVLILVGIVLCVRKCRKWCVNIDCCKGKGYNQKFKERIITIAIVFVVIAIVSSIGLIENDVRLLKETPVVRGTYFENHIL